MTTTAKPNDLAATLAHIAAEHPLTPEQKAELDAREPQLPKPVYTPFNPMPSIPLSSVPHYAEMKAAQAAKVAAATPEVELPDAPVMRKAGSKVSMFDFRDARQWVDIAASRPDPVDLWHGLWYENEVCCLFADTNVGKSIYAVQIADELSRTRKVVYFDFEMSDKQFQLRYTDASTGSRHCFDRRFIRAEFSRNADDIDSVETVINQIQYLLEETGARTVIIDNITWLCNGCESGDAAGEFMQLLVNLKRDMGISILVLAHTPKRNLLSPLTQNSLAGSKRLANFMDSIFAIGIDHTAKPSGRYIKQLKCRNGEVRHGSENVIAATVTKDGDFLCIKHTGSAVESHLLCDPDAESEPSESKRIPQEAIDEIRRRAAEGESLRSISSSMGIHRKTVSRFASRA